jgi:hypothetical protein
MREPARLPVMPAQAGIHADLVTSAEAEWTPAFAGVTECHEGIPS